MRALEEDLVRDVDVTPTTRRRRRRPMRSPPLLTTSVIGFAAFASSSTLHPASAIPGEFASPDDEIDSMRPFQHPFEQTPFLSILSYLGKPEASLQRNGHIRRRHYLRNNMPSTNSLPDKSPSDDPSTQPPMLPSSPESTAHWMQADINAPVGVVDTSISTTTAILCASRDASVVAVGTRFPNHQDGDSGVLQQLTPQVRIYKLELGEWRQIGQGIDGDFHDPESDDDEQEEAYALSLSDNGTVLAVGARFHHGSAGQASGYVRIFQYNTNQGEWVLLGKDISGEYAFDESGYSVSLSGNGQFVAVSSIFNSDGGFGAGHVRVYGYDSSRQEWFLLGKDLDGGKPGDRFGSSVALSQDGMTLAATALSLDGHDDDSDDGGGGDSVSVFRYLPISDVWVRVGQQRISVAGIVSISLSNDGTTLAIGSSHEQHAEHLVTVYRYNANSQAWMGLGQAIGISSFASGGIRVNLSGDGKRVAVGSIQQGGNQHTGMAHVYEYNTASRQWTNPPWLQPLDDDDSKEKAFGSAVAALAGPGESIAVGSWSNKLTGGTSGDVPIRHAP